MRHNRLRAMLLASVVSVAVCQPAFAQSAPAAAGSNPGANSISVDTGTGLPQTTMTAPSAAVGPASTADATLAPLAPNTPSPAGDIVVTARRTNESLQKVPVAVTVLSTDTLAKNNVYDGFSILTQLPGVQGLARNTGNVAVAGLTRIRGVSPVAYYFNDAPLTPLGASLFGSFFDLTNVQVLKGPQGTLFGQASNAGAILNTPRKPGNDFGGYFKASVGNYNLKSVEGAVDIPLVKDVLLMRVAGEAYDRQGYITDSLSGRVVDGIARYEIGRVTVVFKPTSRIESTFMFQGEWDHDIAGGTAGTPGDYDMYDNTLNRTLATLNGMTFAQLNAARDQILANQLKIGPYQTQGWSIGCPATATSPATLSTVPGPNLGAVVPQPCAPGRGYINSYGAFNTTNWDLGGGFSFKNVLGHQWGKQKFQVQYDNDGTRLIGNESNSRNFAYSNPTQKNLSEELQLHGRLSRGLDFVLGGFYYDERNSPTNPLFGNYTTSLAQSASKTFTRTRSYSFYGQGNLDLSTVLPGLTLTLGGRHTWDAAYRTQIVLDPNTLAVLSTNGGPGTPSGEAHWQSNSYTASLQYQVTPSTMFYVTNSKGSSIGGLQNNARAPKFDPDSLNNLEVGLKTTIRSGGMSFRINTAAYYGWYSNVKVSTVQLLPSSPGASNLVLTPTTANAASARIKGFEIEVGASVGRIFDLNAFVSYADPRYTQFNFVNALTLATENLKNQPFALTPKWKLGVSPTINLPTKPSTIGKVSFGASLTYRSEVWANPVKPIIPNDPNNPDTGLICKVRRTAASGYGALSADGRWAYKGCAPSFYNVNAFINWNDVLGHQGVSLAMTVTNLTANSRPAAINSQYDTLNAVGYQPNEPRMAYLTLGYKF